LNVTVKIRQSLARLEQFGTALETVALVMMLSAIIIIGVAQIVLREFFNSGIVWADELIRLIVLWLAMVGSIAACRENRHIRIDALSHVLSSLAVKIVRIVVDLFAAAVVAIIAYHAWRYLQVEIEYEVTVLVDPPAWLAHMILPLAFALIAYRFLVSVIRDAFELVFSASGDSVE